MIFHTRQYKEDSQTNGLNEAWKDALENPGAAVHLCDDAYLCREQVAPQAGSGSMLHIYGDHGLTQIVDGRDEPTDAIFLLKHSGIHLENVYFSRVAAAVDIPILELGGDGYPGDWKLENVSVGGNDNNPPGELVRFSGCLSGEWVNGIVKNGSVGMRFTRPLGKGGNNNIQISGVAINGNGIGIRVDSPRDGRTSTVEGVHFDSCRSESNDTTALLLDRKGYMSFTDHWTETPQGSGYVTHGARLTYTRGVISVKQDMPALRVLGGSKLHVVVDTKLWNNVECIYGASVDVVRHDPMRELAFGPNVRVY